MGFFKRRSQPELAVEEAIRDLAIEEYRRRGFTVTAERDGRYYSLRISEDSHVYLANLTERARQAERQTWPGMVAEFIQVQINAQQAPSASQLSAAELRERVRVRLMPQDPLLPGTWDYAPEFAPGVLKLLAIDYPDRVETLPGDSLEKLAISVDEMYSQGQLNTDAEPIDEHNQAAAGIYALEGESFFISSKAANMAHLVTTVIGPAPFGVAFAIPNRSLLVYSVLPGTVDVEATVQLVNELTQIVVHLTEDEARHLGGVVSRNSYYWAPDGTIEELGTPSEANSKDHAIVIKPGPGFAEHTGLAAEALNPGS
jgi:hypothetical protein